MEKPKSKRHPVFGVKDIHKARSYLEKNQAPFKEETQFPGINRFSCFDPFPNRLEFLEYIVNK